MDMVPRLRRRWVGERGGNRAPRPASPRSRCSRGIRAAACHCRRSRCSRRTDVEDSRWSNRARQSTCVYLNSARNVPYAHGRAERCRQQPTPTTPAARRLRHPVSTVSCRPGYTILARHRLASRLLRPRAGHFQIPPALDTRHPASPLNPPSAAWFEGKHLPCHLLPTPLFTFHIRR